MIMPGSFFDGDSFREYMVLEDCPYCHDAVNYTQIAENPSTVRCNVCGLYRLYPRMNCQGQIAMLKKYNDELDTANYGEPSTSLKLAQWEISQLKQVFPSVFPGGRVLDVGSGACYFAAGLKEAGAVVTGIEPCEKLTEFGNRHGLDIRNGRFEPGGIPSDLKESSFDLICFRESIYYMPDLRETFKLLDTYLRAGGGIYMKCSVVTSWYYLRHNNYSSRYGYYAAGMPSKKSLTYILNHEGYRIRKTLYHYLSVDYHQRLGNKVFQNPSIRQAFAGTAKSRPQPVRSRNMQFYLKSFLKESINKGAFMILRPASIIVSRFRTAIGRGDQVMVFATKS